MLTSDAALADEKGFMDDPQPTFLIETCFTRAVPTSDATLADEEGFKGTPTTFTHSWVLRMTPNRYAFTGVLRMTPNLYAPEGRLN